MADSASRVLIVDDLYVNRMILSSYLATRGIMSDQAEGGLECLELCKERDYDLILMDHRMPDLDGVDTLTQLKDLFKEKKHDVPVICHTMEEGRNNINLYKAAGFADVLIKPVDPVHLFDVIMKYLPVEDEEIPSSGENNNTPDAKGKEFFDEALLEDELDKLPLWLKIVPHIDLNAGLTTCGSAEDYLDALAIFKASAEAKAGDISKNLGCENWTMYRLGVHSLKSMARLIGAMSLSQMAAVLEKCADDSDYKKIRHDTPALLVEYKKFAKLLEPIDQDEAGTPVEKKSTPAKAPAKEPAKEKPGPNTCRSILFIRSKHGAFTNGIEQNLSKKRLSVIPVQDAPDLIINHRFDADIILYYVKSEKDSHIELNMNFLGEICQDDSKILCLIGDAEDVKIAMRSSRFNRVSRTYIRPFDIADLVKDMEYFSSLLEDYRRTKNVYVVDDDPDYLAMLNKWLSPVVNVSSFTSGDEVLSGIDAMIPDLLLIDYEMPGMNGIEIIKALRSKGGTKKIPVIFLTGKNDRDLVYSILNYKPDGYLLKTDSGNAIVDSVKRFFAESFYRKTLPKKK